MIPDAFAKLYHNYKGHKRSLKQEWHDHQHLTTPDIEKLLSKLQKENEHRLTMMLSGEYPPIPPSLSTWIKDETDPLSLHHHNGYPHDRLRHHTPLP